MELAEIFVGADVGASRTKVAVIDDHKRLIGYAVEKSGTDFTATAERCLKTALDMAGASPDDIRAVSYTHLRAHET